MRNGIKIYLLLLIFFCVVVSDSQAKNKHPEDSTWNNWNFRISPYFWFMAFEGTIYRPPYPTQYPEPEPSYDIDVGFKDIKNSIKFAAMLAGQYRNKKMVVQFNFSSLILEGEAITPIDLVLQDISYRFDFYAGDLAVGYRLVRNREIEFDILGGLKFIYFRVGGRTNIVGKWEFDIDRKIAWVDPVFGANFRYRPHKRIEFVTYADIGGRLFGSDLSYQFIGNVIVFVSRTFFITTGYRVWGVDHPTEEAVFTGKVKGWIVRFGFQF